MSDVLSADEIVSSTNADRSTENLELTSTTQEKDEKTVKCIQHMKCVNRIKNFPVILNSLKIFMEIYERIKSLGSVTHCLCNISEKSARLVMELVDSINAQIPFECPRQTIDSVVCTGLDCVESIIAEFKQPPHEIYNNGKKCFSDLCTSIQKFIYSLMKYGRDTFNEYLFISACLIGVIQDWIQESISTSYSEQPQHQLTHAEYEMIIEAIRTCVDYQKQMGYQTSPTESSADISSPISDLSIE